MSESRVFLSSNQNWFNRLKTKYYSFFCLLVGTIGLTYVVTWPMLFEWGLAINAFYILFVLFVGGHWFYYLFLFLRTVTYLEMSQTELVFSKWEDLREIPCDEIKRISFNKGLLAVWLKAPEYWSVKVHTQEDVISLYVFSGSIENVENFGEFKSILISKGRKLSCPDDE